MTATNPVNPEPPINSHPAATDRCRLRPARHAQWTAPAAPDDADLGTPSGGADATRGKQPDPRRRRGRPPRPSGPPAGQRRTYTSGVGVCGEHRDRELDAKGRDEAAPHQPASRRVAVRGQRIERTLARTASATARTCAPALATDCNEPIDVASRQPFDDIIPDPAYRCA